MIQITNSLSGTNSNSNANTASNQQSQTQQQQQAQNPIIVIPHSTQKHNIVIKQHRGRSNSCHSSSSSHSSKSSYSSHSCHYCDHPCPEPQKFFDVDDLDSENHDWCSCNPKKNEPTYPCGCYGKDNGFCFDPSQSKRAIDKDVPSASQAPAPKDQDPASPVPSSEP